MKLSPHYYKPLFSRRYGAGCGASIQKDNCKRLTHSQWSGGDEKFEALVERLNEQIDTAEKSRAADFRLLRNWREAIAAHTLIAPEAESAPALPPQKLVHDDFGDGNFIRNPAWAVVEW